MTALAAACCSDRSLFMHPSRMHDMPAMTYDVFARWVCHENSNHFADSANVSSPLLSAEEGGHTGG